MGQASSTIDFATALRDPTAIFSEPNDIVAHPQLSREMKLSLLRQWEQTARSQAGPDTKHARIIAMLRTPAGATIASLVTATEWQQHSVRGFLAGVVRKKLGLNLVSEQTDKGRVYRIRDGKASPAAADRAKQAA
jgi:hypothetical protein